MVLDLHTLVADQAVYKLNEKCLQLSFPPPPKAGTDHTFSDAEARAKDLLFELCTMLG